MTMFMNEDIAYRLREFARPNASDHDVYPNLMKITMQEAADEIERLRAALDPPHGKPEKLRIYINRSLDITPNKRAAHAVHAALTAFGVHPGVKVIVLDKGPTAIRDMRVYIEDAGHTELEPGTLTAGTNWPLDSEA